MQFKPFYFSILATATACSIGPSLVIAAGSSDSCKCGYDAIPTAPASKGISAYESMSVKQQEIQESLASVDLDSVSPEQKNAILELIDGFNTVSNAPDSEKKAFYETISAKKSATTSNISRKIPATVAIGEISKRLSTLRSRSKHNSYLPKSTGGRKTGSISLPILFNQNNNELPGGLLAQRLSGFVSSDHVVSKQSETTTESRFDSSNQRLVAGADYRVDNQTFVGLAFNTVSGRADMGDNGGTLINKANTLVGYGTYNIKPNWYVEGVISSGSRSFDMDRAITFTLNDITTNTLACSQPESNHIGFSFGSGFSKTFRNGHSLGAVISLNQTYSSIKSFSEKGCNNNLVAYSLVVDEINITSNILSIGGQWSQPISASFGVLIPQLSFNWIKELEGSSDTISAYFSNDPNKTTMAFESGNKDTVYLNSRFSITMVLPRGLSGFFLYETQQLMDDYQQNTISLGVRKEF
ncbi:MAG: autotransporter outer membrane beta-barrel domain-containing protein [Gammaproteobacteria bacterium]|nr:autotransporter outer membrane beta-barrel domain-containing protein [Gammaproteobacteria bacterium]